VPIIKQPPWTKTIPEGGVSANAGEKQANTKIPAKNKRHIFFMRLILLLN
jgi:hypothetical protein